MSNKDEFELDVEDTADESFDDVNLDEEMESSEGPAPKKKKSGGGLLIAVLLLAVLGGGGFAAVKFMGVQLPFDVPGLTQTAQAPQQPTGDTPADAADTTMTASADLPAGELPPQPIAPADETMAATENVPFGIPEDTTPDTSASVTAPWGMEETPAAAAQGLKQPPVETFDGSAPATQADSGNVVDPFAMQDVTEAVNAAAAPVVAAPEQADVVDPFAALTNTAVETAAAPQPEASVAAAAAPVADAAAQARVKELETKLSATEQSLAAAEKALKKANDELAQKAAALTQAQADLKAAQTAAAKSSVNAVTTKPAESVATTTTAKPVAAKPAAPVRKIDWVLRSAKPGMAWVSEKGSTEMRTVSVGDTLAGIGKVTSIATDAQGRWVVNGTRGSINQ